MIGKFFWGLPLNFSLIKYNLLYFWFEFKYNLRRFNLLRLHLTGERVIVDKTERLLAIQFRVVDSLLLGGIVDFYNMPFDRNKVANGCQLPVIFRLKCVEISYLVLNKL